MSGLKLFFCIAAVGLVSLDLPSELRCAACSRAERAGAQESQQKSTDQNVMSISPIACNLTALNKEQRKRHQQLTEELRGLAQEVRELSDGYAFVLPADGALIQKAAEWMTVERLCCPFIAFNLEVGREGGPISLSLTGREGVKPFLKAELKIR